VLTGRLFMWPVSSEYPLAEPWYTGVRIVITGLLGGMIGALLGLLLGLIASMPVRLAALGGLLAGIGIAILAFKLFGSTTDAGRADPALTSFAYLCVGELTGLILGAAVGVIALRRVNQRRSVRTPFLGRKYGAGLHTMLR